MATLKTPEAFFTEYNGKAVNKGNGWNDSAFGYQCVAGFKAGCEWLGIPVIPTPNNRADGYWTCLRADGSPSASTAEWQEKYFYKVRQPEQFKDGDWVIWGRGSQSSSHPSSHVAMYYHGMEFGENQGVVGFSLKNTDFSDALGALRPKAWGRIPEYESDLTINSHLYHLYGQSADLRAVVLSPGLNKTAKIQDLDCNYWVYSRITGCNYFQMREDIPDQPYGMTFGDISAPISGVYQNLPNQDSTMFFDIETGEHADCTGVDIDPSHNVFSPALIYQRGTNVQYARMVGLSLCNSASMYAFLIRYNNGTYCFGITDSELTPNQINADIMSIIDVDSISIIDGGGSAQMMRYITKEHRAEYTRDTGRATAGCIALIGNPVPSDTPIAPPQEEEDEDMNDEVIQGPAENEVVVVNPADPVPVKKSVGDLVKSIVTIALTITFCYMNIVKVPISDQFMLIYMSCISFFFGTSFGKRTGGDSK